MRSQSLFLPVKSFLDRTSRLAGLPCSRQDFHALDRTSMLSTGPPYPRQDFHILDRTSIFLSGLPYELRTLPAPSKSTIYEYSLVLRFIVKINHGLRLIHCHRYMVKLIVKPLEVTNSPHPTHTPISPFLKVILFSLSCRMHGSPVESMEVLQSLWKSCRVDGGPAECREVLPSVWKSCRVYGSPAERL